MRRGSHFRANRAKWVCELPGGGGFGLAIWIHTLRKRVQLQMRPQNAVLRSPYSNLMTPRKSLSVADVSIE